MAVMAVWAAVLIAYGVSTGIAMEAPVYDLDMAPNSVDDMYRGCKEQMKTKVEEEYLPNEMNTDSEFKQVWLNAEKKYAENFKGRDVIPGKEQIVALYVYSFGANDYYKNINHAVRTQRSEYKTTFKYHALHFYLTNAIQTLKAQEGPLEKRCYKAYRGVDLDFNQDVRNKEIRFGSFTSSSQFPHVAKKFGTKSCFEIYTCYGVDISLYSKFGEAEAEVLIPPYEVFKVTNIKKPSEQQIIKCDVVYEVKSTKRTFSNLNCDLFKK